MTGPGSPRRSPPKAVKCLLPVWGHRHTRQFLEFGLPTLLAAGNVPALAAALPCEFVVATSGEDAATILEHPNWRLLADICPTRLEAIDDLISDASHATSLTLAYARMIRATGAAMTDCCFLFLVADFLIADGSLTAVLNRLQAGASGVLAGNFQVAAEDMAPHLAGSPGARSLAARALVRLSLAHLHPATNAAIVNGGFRQDAATNRLFWRVDDDTMLGRFYLAHMIGIRPEVTDFAIGSACDYSFIPELCPSGNVEFMTDSDEYFAVEMQPRGDETPLRAEKLDVGRLAADLSKWTTARHRQNAQTTILFHAWDIPATTPAVSSQADATIRAIDRALSPVPCPHRDHPYWIGGLALHGATTGRPLDAELGYRPAGRSSSATALLWRLRLSAFGRPPSVRPWHPRAPDFIRAWKTLAAGTALPRNLLVIASEPRTFAHWLRPIAGNVTALDTGHVLTGLLPAPAESFNTCLIVLPPEALASVPALLAKISSSIEPNSPITLLVTKNPADEVSVFAPQGVAVTEQALRQDGWAVGLRHIEAGSARCAVQHRLIGLTHSAKNSPRAYLPFFAIVWAGLTAISYACNLAAMRPMAGPPPDRCSSVLLTLRWAGQPENATAARTAGQVGSIFRRHPDGLKTLCAAS
jgi:hypothetical protein